MGLVLHGVEVSTRKVAMCSHQVLGRIIGALISKPNDELHETLRTAAEYFATNATRSHIPNENDEPGDYSSESLQCSISLKYQPMTSYNAVKSQLWIAIFVYVSIAIIRKRLNLELNLHTILQILSLSVFE